MDVCGLGTLASFTSIAKSTEMEFLSGVFHLGCGIYYICGTYWDFQIVTPHVNTYGGRWKFLTFLNLIIQLLYFIIAPLGDVVTLLSGRRDNWLVKLRDLLFSSLAFPLGVFVAATFWGIYLMDRELIFPRALDKIFPSWLNHILHTWCAILIILEAAFIKHKYPKNRVGLGVLAVFTAIYLSWISWIAYAADFWVYPFLRLMPNSGKVAFFTLASCLSAFLYLLGKWMTLFIWGGDGEKKSTNNSTLKEGTKKRVKKAD